MTLLDLSEKSGVALATLSRIENGKMTGTLKSHIKICAAFGIPLTDLYKELPSSKKTLDVKTSPAGPKVSIHDRKSSSVMLVSGVQSKKMLPLLIAIVKGGRTAAEETSRGIEKFIYVLNGKVETVIGEEKYVLCSGDTVYFDSSTPHYFRNLHNGESRLISISSRL
jgi:quercetin dioxygenase-like cupin family protein/DNA-binding Xre family transcriptional regulator